MHLQELTVTVFAPALDDDQVAAAQQVLFRAGLTVTASRMLKRRDTNAPAHRFSVVAKNAFDDERRRGLLDAAESIGVDIFMQAASPPVPRLFAFDMDSTLIEVELIDELARLTGVEDRVAPITERAMRGEIEFRVALAERVALLRGLNTHKVEELNERVRFSPGVEALMRGLNTAGCITLVVSGGFGCFGRYAQQRLGFEYMVSNELETAGDKLTGKLTGQIVDADGKRSALVAIAERENIPLTRTVAVGDGANDLPMLRTAAVGVAYRAKPAVRAAARYRLNFGPMDSLLHLLG